VQAFLSVQAVSSLQVGLERGIRRCAGRKLGSNILTPWLREALEECYARNEWKDRFRTPFAATQFQILSRFEPHDHLISGSNGRTIVIRFFLDDDPEPTE